MPSDIQTAPLSKKMLWTGRILSTLAVLFLLFDAIGHLIMPAPVVQAFVRIGIPLGLARPLGILEIVCVVIYLVPRASILGAILLTGYLGGAVAINWRVGDPLFETLFPVIFGTLVWGGIWFRDERLRALMPVRP